MGDLVSINTAKKRKDDHLLELWNAYRAARERAEHSDDIEDGIRAGKAWANWLDAFQAVNS